MKATVNDQTTTDFIAKRPALPLSGGCLCNAIRYKVAGYPRLLYACHCTNCQRQSGSAFAMNMLLSAADFHIVQGEPKGWQRVSSSGAETTSWFCGDCACRIYGSRPNRPETLTLRAGSLDDTSICSPAAHLFVRGAQPWVNLPVVDRFDKVPPDFGPVARLGGQVWVYSGIASSVSKRWLSHTTMRSA